MGWTLTPSLRVATFSHVNTIGEDVLVETDLKTKLCRHGETSTAIRTWVLAEARARAAGLPPPKRASMCDCLHTHGLQNRIDTRPPTPPTCVYDVLASNGVKEMDIGGDSPALQLGDRDVFLTSSGSLYCSHKARMTPITKAVRPFVFRVNGKCQCELTLPRRAAKVPLGRK